MKAVLSPAEATRTQNRTTRFCLAVILFLYSTAVLNVIVPRMGYSADGVGNFAVLTLLTALGTGLYLQCIYADPGRVPPGWQPDAEKPQVVQQVKRRGGGARYCKKCAAYKPPRTHHCRRCGHCVLRMDHHCAWTNNCVGHGNYRAFMLMCIYLAAACLHALSLILRMNAHLVSLALGWDEDSQLLAASEGSASTASSSGSSSSGSSSSVDRIGWGGPFWLHSLAQVAATALGLPIAVGLVVLLVWNAYLFLRNTTTIEHHEGVVAQYMAGGGKPRGHLFDLGPHDNLHAVCGDNLLCWLLPGRADAAGDGLSFPTRL
ncbi:putative S-acyltransferase 16 [Chlorella sorokiniana]|uniref:S-acyltransferase n=1 Tax=Chlorella sorokiniana TaxID=3076 RepID=A0A2P6TS15_CHLSO|nr:putative S-acyltransferase 16 [Chlorella sorokiniana]|eukprot:PRW56844.1 putative S-acyltransferase 16 [Chlorella sorokiniana]